MEEFDPQKAARVWQRVQARPEAPVLRQDSLIASMHTQAQRYFWLSRMLPGKAGGKMGEFHRQLRNSADCIRGICRINGTEAVCAGGSLPRPGNLPAQLEQTCREEQRLVQLLCAQSPDPEWGRVYAHLAAEGAVRCAFSLQLLGRT